MPSACLENIVIRAASTADIEAILAVLSANLSDPSLFQRTHADIVAALSEYLVATCQPSEIIGCAALHRYYDGSAELHSVAVLPQWQGRHIGQQLVTQAKQQAAENAIPKLWLGTMKPAYFARFGFVPMSRWRIPLRIMVPKIKSVFAQPSTRWLPALLGSHTFMVLAEPPPKDYGVSGTLC